MAIIFTQEKKKQRYLLIVLGLIVLLFLGIVWWSFSAEETSQPSVEPAIVLPEVTVNFDVLKSPALEGFQMLADIPTLQGTVGRSNPFISY